MLELKNITKDYVVGNGKYRALNNLSVKFSPGEFVAIVGPSGCGKTTTLNIIGGLDRYTEGDLIINGRSTKDFKDSDWDAYRNNSIGFVFQSYNLINHLSVLDNVELGMTLSGVEKYERKKRAIKVLKRVGLSEQIYKKPTLLSGGEKQRVAIARALVNDPDIILADEPTGALDTKTAKEILDLIKEISHEKLVIMVTHARELAEEYASRTVKLLDGELVDDSNSLEELKINDKYESKRTSMSFLTALKLSFNNLRTKKKRTFITAIASSIGIIGVGLVLAVSNGFDGILKNLESDELVGLPITIFKYENVIRMGPPEKSDELNGEEIIVSDPKMERHINEITGEYLDYIKRADYSSIQYSYGYQPNLIIKNNLYGNLISSNSINFSTLLGNSESLDENYSVLKGAFPKENTDVVLLVTDNNVDKNILVSLGLDISKNLTFDDVIGLKIYAANNDDYFLKVNDNFIPKNAEFNDIADKGTELTITGVVSFRDPDSVFGTNGIYYLSDLEYDLIDRNKSSEVCISQNNQNMSVFDGTILNDNDKQDMLSVLGCNNVSPMAIQIYSDSFESKESIKTYLEEWNKDLEEDVKIVYTDFASTIGDTLGSIIGMISTVLTAFASISLVVSSIMIGIIIYISVLERTKEIGVIRSLGGRKKDIVRVFNAESVIIGFLAGVIGVLITILLTIPINLIVENVEPTLSGVAKMNNLHSVFLVIISTFLTFIGGFIPARIAAKKDPVEALRTE